MVGRSGWKKEWLKRLDGGHNGIGSMRVVDGMKRGWG